MHPHEQAAYKDHKKIYPTLYVVGVPRSGTTLVNQVIASSFDLGYINQLIASMWQAPLFGYRLSNKLLPEGLVSDYQSEYGGTHDLSEPHEFGYFWAEHLGYKNLMQPTAEEIAAVEWSQLRKIIQNLSAAGDRPFVFKPLMLTWYIDTLIQHAPESRFVWIERDPLQTALSILHMRKKMTGNLDAWLSLKPAGYPTLKEATPYEQVAGQVAAIHHALEQHYQQFKQSHMLRVRYEDFCAAPQDTLNQVASLMKDAGAELTPKPPWPKKFSISHYQRDCLPEIDRLESDLAAAFAQFN